jgi:hypothetical protein
LPVFHEKSKKKRLKLLKTVEKSISTGSRMHTHPRVGLNTQRFSWAPDMGVPKEGAAGHLPALSDFLSYLMICLSDPIH